MNTFIKDSELIVSLEGRLDSLTAPAFDKELQEILAAEAGGCTSLVLDAEKLTYISSSGFRVLLGLQKYANLPVSIRNVSLEVYESFELTGLTSIMDIRKRLRQISVEGCEVIGEGARGIVYRLDADTVVKVYKCPLEEARVLIESERKKARIALIHGISTALPYDEVRVGDFAGSVFELVDARSFHSIFLSNPALAGDIIRQYVNLIKTVHRTEVTDSELPLARDQFLARLETIRDLLPEHQYLRLRQLLADIPEDHHLVHGDISMKNVMLSGEQEVLIDMDTLSTGQPVFDLQALFVTYKAFPEDDPTNPVSFMQLTAETCTWLWQEILQSYYETDDPALLSKVSDEIRILAYIHFLYLLKMLHEDQGELASRRVSHTLEHLEELLARVDRLCSVDASPNLESPTPIRLPWPARELPAYIHDISEIFREAGYEVYLAGGCVRDMFLHRAPKDYAFITSASGEQILDLMQRHGYAREGQYLSLNGETKWSINPFKGGSLRSDLFLRDLSINSLAYDIQAEEIIDFTGGITDLQNGIIRLLAPLTPEDSGKLLRIIRFSLELGFKVDPLTYRNALESVSILENAHPSTLVEGIGKLLAGGKDVLLHGRLTRSR